MNTLTSEPQGLPGILKETHELGFDMASDRACGSLLRTLAASKPAGQFLELGTGTGLSTAWLLDGMDGRSRLVSVDNDAVVQEVAKRLLGADSRVQFVTGEASDFLRHKTPGEFDLIFADTWAGKYELLEETLALLKPGGLYFLDDLLPQPNWPDGHEMKVARLKSFLASCSNLRSTWMPFSTGLWLAVKT